MENIIWCIEDEEGIRDVEIYALNSTGFRAFGFEDASSALVKLREEKPDLIILDVMLPGMDGIEFLTRIRASASNSDIPVIMATAKGAEYDKIKTLDLGADDYLVKPFGVMEMVSRVRAVLRRYKKDDKAVLRLGGVELRRTERTVSVNGEKIALTFKEFELLCLLMSHPGSAFSREQIFSAVWGGEFYGETRTLDAHIRSLRVKLGDCGSMIETVRGVGYKMEDV